MPWVWSDELAARLVERGVLGAEALDGLAAQPVAYAVRDPEDLVDLGRELLGIEPEQEAVAS